MLRIGSYRTSRLRMPRYSRLILRRSHRQISGNRRLASLHLPRPHRASPASRYSLLKQFWRTRLQRKSKAPRRFSAGGLCQIVIKPVLEVPLSADQHNEGVLVRGCVPGGRLRDGGLDGQVPGTAELLVKVGPSEVSREGQVLDRGPAGDNTELSCSRGYTGSWPRWSPRSACWR